MGCQPTSALEQLLYRVEDSGLTAYWCRWRCLVDLQRAAGGLKVLEQLAVLGCRQWLDCLLV